MSMTRFPEIARLKVGESHIFPFDRTVAWVFWMRVASAANRLSKKVGDGLRETFGAKLTWLQTQTMTVGTEPEWGVPTQWRGERRRA